MAEHDHILAGQSGLKSGFSTAFIFQNHEPDIAKTLSILSQLSEFRDTSSLVLAIDRLGRSRGNSDIVNRAVDLGMALEVALMHDDKNEKEEINAKLGLRAGWLLGSTSTERLDVKKRAGKLYSARSTATHTGKLDSAKFDIEDADALVAQLIGAILTRGQFPDWNDLTFGGLG